MGKVMGLSQEAILQAAGGDGFCFINMAPGTAFGQPAWVIALVKQGKYNMFDISGLVKSKDILRWKDALYTGPVPAGLTLEQLSKLRSQFWTEGKWKNEFEKRDAQLRNWTQYDGIVLWDGPTSLSQLSLVQILTWLHERKADPNRLSLVTAYAGTLSPDQLSDAFAARKQVSAGHLKLADRFWTAFTAATPVKLQRLLRADLRLLPEIRPAIVQLLQEYPAVQDGLSRLERKLLLEIDAMGAASAVFPVASILPQELVGDTLLFDMLRRFVSATNPLLSFAEPFHGRLETHEFNRAKLKLTQRGRRVLAGKDDYIACNGIDRWIGGVHLTGNRIPWRWDERQQKIVASKK